MSVDTKDPSVNPSSSGVSRQEFVELFDRLPDEKRVEVADFARFLLSRQAQESDGDAAWERIIADSRPRPKLEAYARESEAEGSEPLDLDEMRRLAELPTAATT